MKLRNRQNNRNSALRLVAFVGLLAGLDILFFHVLNRPAIAQKQVRLRPYTSAELALYNGTDPGKPTLLAMDGYVYDVSTGRESYYGPGKPYHLLAGADASALLHIAGGDIVAKKYTVVGILAP
jgi:predicted heme/steroid binding protein